MTDDPGKVRAKMTYELAMERAQGTAGHFQPGYGTQELKPDDELDIFLDQGETPMPLEKIHELYRQGLTQEQIGLLMHPKREQLYKSGRPEPKAFITKANALARRAAIKEAGTLEVAALPSDSVFSQPPPMDGGLTDA